MAIDLEHFPTNETALRMMERISPIYDRSYVGKWIFEVMGMEMGEARTYLEELRLQPFPEQATWTISYWEQRYAITPNPTDTLAVRQQRIIIKQSAQLPMNPALMENIINRLTGGKTSITEDVDDYTFSILIDDPVLSIDIPQIIKEVKKLKPSHQNFTVSVAQRAKAALHVGGVVQGQYLRVGVNIPIPAEVFAPHVTAEPSVCAAQTGMVMRVSTGVGPIKEDGQDGTLA